jgi:hypothetical protein
MNIANHVHESETLIQWLDSRIHGLQMPSSFRFRLAAGCLDVALEHQKAIVLLISGDLYGSAFAISRVLLEAYVRGVWLHQCASDADLKRFEVGTLDRTFGNLVEDIEKLEGFSVGVLSAMKKSSWSTMCGFTHTGFGQVVRRNKESTIEPNYEEAAVLELLDFSDGIGLMAAVQIAHLANDNALAAALLDRARATSKLSPNPTVERDAREGSARPSP